MGQNTETLDPSGQQVSKKVLEEYAFTKSINQFRDWCLANDTALEAWLGVMQKAAADRTNTTTDRLTTPQKNSGQPTANTDVPLPRHGEIFSEMQKGFEPVHQSMDIVKKLGKEIFLDEKITLREIIQKGLQRTSAETILLTAAKSTLGENGMEEAVGKNLTVKDVKLEIQNTAVREVQKIMQLEKGKEKEKTALQHDHDPVKTIHDALNVMDSLMKEINRGLEHSRGLEKTPDKKPEVVKNATLSEMKSPEHHIAPPPTAINATLSKMQKPFKGGEVVSTIQPSREMPKAPGIDKKNLNLQLGG